MHLARFFVPTEFLQCLSCRKGGSISEIYKLCEAYPENRDEYRAEAYETCPGLTELWTEPFTARYDSKDSPVMLRFRMTDSGDVQVAANILEAK